MRIDRFKAMMRNAINARKQIKQKIVQMEDILSKLSETSIECVYMNIFSIISNVSLIKLIGRLFIITRLLFQYYANVCLIHIETCRLHISVIEITDALETIKINADDQYKLMELQFQEYQNIINEYKETWHAYHVSN